MEKHYYPLKKNKNIFVGQQLSTIIQQFLFVHRLHRLNRFFLLVNNYQQLSTIFICPQITQIKQIFLLVNNHQQLSNNFICPQITQITQIFVGQQLSTIIQQFLFVHRLHRLNRFFLLVNNHQQLSNNFYLSTDYTD